MIFQTEFAADIIFKGGTSLSKGWALIERFSEDIDLALDRKRFNVPVVPSNTQLKKLRRKSNCFLKDEFYPILAEQFNAAGFTGIILKIKDGEANDQDPVTIEVEYPTILGKSEYLHQTVLIEIGCRSMREPNTPVNIRSFVGEYFQERDFADSAITIATVNPERTFLEKVFLLHEEFQKDSKIIRVERLSRHLYDLEKLMDTEYGEKALKSVSLYNQIVEHRRTVTPVRGIDYVNHAPAKIRIVPPDAVWDAYRQDYFRMRENMIHGDAPAFEDLIKRIMELQLRINMM